MEARWYPTCRHCKKRYINDAFLSAHIKREHLELNVKFIQARFRYKKLQRVKETLKAKLNYNRFAKLKRVVNNVKAIYLQNTYKFGGKGYKRLLNKFNNRQAKGT